MDIGAGLAGTTGARFTGAGLAGTTGARFTGAGLRVITITGVAADAGVASMTLGLGFGAARPTPIIAKFESSISRGHGFNV